MTHIDPIEEALDTVLHIDHICSKLEQIYNKIIQKNESKKLDKCGSSIARRFSDLPSLIVTTGLIPVLTFYLSKLSREDNTYFKHLLKLFREKTNLNKIIEDLARDQSKKDPEKQKEKIIRYLVSEFTEESKGYLIGLIIITNYLNKVNIVNIIDGYDLKYLAKDLKEIREGKSKPCEIIVQKILEPYLLELKKLTRGLFGEK